MSRYLPRYRQDTVCVWCYGPADDSPCPERKAGHRTDDDYRAEYNDRLDDA